MAGFCAMTLCRDLYFLVGWWFVFSVGCVGWLWVFLLGSLVWLVGCLVGSVVLSFDGLRDGNEWLRMFVTSLGAVLFPRK